jgi:hypothetical protein
MKRTIRIPHSDEGGMLLDIVSYGRGGQPLTPHQRQHIALTIRRVPEVMVKVSGGARTLAGVERHMKYIGRKGELGLETDMGARVGGATFARSLVEDWDLDTEALDRQFQRFVRGRKPPKLVHNLIFSMPPGTRPGKVLQAVKKLAVNEWQSKHRYAMTLHTDTPHPHVHVVVKAMSEQGVRLNIKKATLRSWRSQFAANLLELGVAANATERAVRGAASIHKSDGLFRSNQQGRSTRMEQLQKEILSEIRAGGRAPEAGVERIRRTRGRILNGWQTVAAKLRATGDHGFADRIQAFTSRMQAPQTAKGWLSHQMLERSKGRKLAPRIDAPRDRTR